MGRIEDAIQKLQARRGVPVQRENAAALRLGRVAIDGDGEHSYRGKRIEIDHAALRAQGMLASDHQERRMQEEYRAIKRPLLSRAGVGHEPRVERGNLLMVTSAVPGEGKTFTCINLCLSIAREKDWSVVLVDGDCAKPHLSRMFNAERESGLLDLLRDPAMSLEAAVMPTNVPGLSVLPAGARDPQSAELLASSRMQSLCRSLSESDPQRIFIFDSSPLLATTESAVLASHVGQILVVVRANDTPQKAVTSALEKLDQSKAICLVLNRLYGKDGDGGHSDYGYGTYGV